MTMQWNRNKVTEIATRAAIIAFIAVIGCTGCSATGNRSNPMNSTAATVESGVGGKPAWTSAAYNGGTVTAAGINAGQAEPGSTQPVPGRTDSLRFAPTIAYELTKLEGVAAAQVVLAGESAYAAVRLKPGIGAEAKTLAPAIARHMLELSPPQIKYAYVTDNAEFAERLAFYSKEERRTGSWRKYKEEFESAVNLLFAGRKDQ